MAIWARSKLNQLSKGYYKKGHNSVSVQIKRIYKALQYQYVARKVRRRIMKRNCIISLNAATREHNVPYSTFVYGLNRSNIGLDRKILSQLAKYEPYSFKAVIDEIRQQVDLSFRLPKPDEVSFHNAIERNLIYHGQFVDRMKKDIEIKFIDKVDDNAPDWFGTKHPDYPRHHIEQDRKLKQVSMSLKEMKKHRFTAYDDIPSDPEDEF